MLQSWLKFRKFRKATYEAINHLVRADVASLLFRSNPGARSIAKQFAREGQSPEYCAVTIMAAAYPSAVTKGVSEERLRLIFQQLRELHLNGQVLTGDPDYVTLTFQWMSHVLNRWTALGLVTEAAADLLMTEIIGTFGGYSAEQRRSARLKSTLQ